MVNSGFARLVANIVIMGGGVFSRAFLDAYKQAVKNGGTAARAGLRGGGISVDEARNILALKPKATPAEITEAYTRLHAMNEQAKGGSAYLQAKVSNAHAALTEAPPAAAAPGTGASGKESSSK